MRGTHKKIINEANKRIALERDMVLGLFGAVAASVGGAFMSDILQRSLSANTYLLEGAKAIEGFIVSQGFNAMKGNNLKGLVGTKPVVFLESVQSRVSAEAGIVHGFLAAMKYEAQVDPLKLVNTKLHETKVLSIKVDVKEAEKAFELRLWKLWVKEKGADFQEPSMGYGPLIFDTIPQRGV